MIWSLPACLRQASAEAAADASVASSANAPAAAVAINNGNKASSSSITGGATSQADAPATDGASRRESNGAAPTSSAAASASVGPTPASSSSTPVQDSMRRKLTEALAPVRLEIYDESAQHAGHVGSRMQAGYSGETHFRVDVTSPAFKGLKTLKQHRLIYDVRRPNP